MARKRIEVNSSCLSRLLVFMLIYLSILDTAMAVDTLNFKFDPSEAYRGDTTTFVIQLTSEDDLKNIEIKFLADGLEKGTKYLSDLEKNERRSIDFDYLFEDRSYLGEHYIELKINSSFKNGTIFSKRLYKIVIIKDKSWLYLLSQHWPIFLFNLIVILFILSVKILFFKGLSMIAFDPVNRKTILGLILTILPIATSYFIFIIDQIALRINIVLIIMLFTISYILAIYTLMRLENEDPDENVRANNFTVYSLSFLLFGLINMLISVIFLIPFY